MKPEKSISRLTKRIFGLLAGPAAILCAVSVSPVQAGDLFYTTCCFDGTNSDLVAINVQDVNHITSKLIGAIPGTAALALSPSGTLYSMVGIGNFFVSQQLATIDPVTTSTTLVGVPVPGLAVMAMGFSPDGILYAVGNCNPNFNSPVGAGCTPVGTTNYNALYTVDVGTGAFTLIGSTGAPLYFMDLAFDRDGNMYGVTCDLFPSSGDPSTLYRIDRATGAATKIFDLVGSTSVMGLAFGRNGKLYATDWYSNNSALYSVDMKTGFLTAIATIGYGTSSGLELAPAGN